EHRVRAVILLIERERELHLAGDRLTLGGREIALHGDLHRLSERRRRRGKHGDRGGCRNRSSDDTLHRQLLCLHWFPPVTGPNTTRCAGDMLWPIGRSAPITTIARYASDPTLPPPPVGAYAVDRDRPGPASGASPASKPP